LLAAQIFLARTLATRGRLRQAAAQFQALLLQSAGGEIPILALAHYDLSTIYYEWDQLPQAAEHLQRGLELSVRSGNVEFQNAGHILRAFLALAQGNPDEALQAVEHSHALAREYSPATRARSAACHAHLALALSDLEAAADWAGQAPADVDAHSFYRFLNLSRARLLIAQGQKRAAAAELQACYDRASRAGWGCAVIAVRILQTLASDTPENALVFLSDALHQAQSEGFIRAFAEAGAGLAPHLKEAARRGVLPDYVGRILAAIGNALPPAAPDQTNLVEPLSERELEVLRLVAAGLSNREIAARLVISLGTAKTHIHNLCGKLGTRNRTEAAMLAKDLRLV
jgi:LuxR family maltose regulon positive regulatory protein